MERRSFLGTLGKGFGAATVGTLFVPEAMRRVQRRSTAAASYPCWMESAPPPGPGSSLSSTQITSCATIAGS